MLPRSNKNLKKIFGPTRPGNPPSGHAFIFRAIFTSKILKFGLLSMKESLYMPGSDLLGYKWAKKESFFQSPKSVRCTEMLWAWHVARSPPVTQPYIVENRENQL